MRFIILSSVALLPFAFALPSVIPINGFCGAGGPPENGPFTQCGPDNTCVPICLGPRQRAGEGLMFHCRANEIGWGHCLPTGWLVQEGKSLS